MGERERERRFSILTFYHKSISGVLKTMGGEDCIDVT